jgi:hypothetical protein
VWNKQDIVRFYFSIDLNSFLTETTERNSISTSKCKIIYVCQKFQLFYVKPIICHRVLSTSTCDIVLCFWWDFLSSCVPYVVSFSGLSIFLFFFFLFFNIDFFSYKQHFATFYVSLYDIYTINTIKQ